VLAIHRDFDPFVQPARRAGSLDDPTGSAQNP
jgi:hypothetical protein